MADWSLWDEWTPDPAYDHPFVNPFYPEKPQPPVKPPQAQLRPPPSPTLNLLLAPSPKPSLESDAPLHSTPDYGAVPRGENPREIRNKAEKQRRDKLNHSIAELAAMVPTVVSASRKVDKTGVLRLTAHYLRAHQYVFGDAIDEDQQFSAASAQMLLGLLKGFLLTTTYRGLVVVVSKNVQQYLGYSELDLLGQNIFNIIHPEDLHIMRDNLMPESHLLGPNGELLIPEDPETKKQLAALLANEKRSFIVRFKKMTQRSEPSQYVSCHIEGSLRKSDRACRGYTRCCQVVRRARARGDNPCNSGNDVVFIGLVRPTCETFKSESSMESYKMEYRTRHSIDGEIIQCEQRIALVTGYMTHEVNGVNAMNFMHRDDVRWVIIALREMYDQHRVVGESCYRLMTKNGQFVYMRTRGKLDVDGDSRAVRSFVCTNTVVDEEEGKHLIRQMKRKFMLLVNNNETVLQEDEIKDVTDNHSVPLEDPRQLEKVILHLVTNLPSPQPDEGACSPKIGSPALPLAIIPPKRERIVLAIENFYTVFNTMDPGKPVEPPEQPPDTTTPTTLPSPQPDVVPQPAETPRENRSPASCNNCQTSLACCSSNCNTTVCRADVYNFNEENSNNQPMTYTSTARRILYQQPELSTITAQLRSPAYAQVTSREGYGGGQINHVGGSVPSTSTSSSSIQNAPSAGVPRGKPSSGLKRPNENRSEQVTSSKKKTQDELNLELQQNELNDFVLVEIQSYRPEQTNQAGTTQVNLERPELDSATTTHRDDDDIIDRELLDPSLEYSMQLLVEDLGGPSFVDSLMSRESLDLFPETNNENENDSDDDDE